MHAKNLTKRNLFLLVAFHFCILCQFFPHLLFFPVSLNSGARALLLSFVWHCIRNCEIRVCRKTKLPTTKATTYSEPNARLEEMTKCYHSKINSPIDIQIES